ncbi:MAG: VWA domain-containing protein [Deltaproteobacteria bacterium]|nr:VWA domain-containing protein [Deltaproteobacteria bacterium]
MNFNRLDHLYWLVPVVILLLLFKLIRRSRKNYFAHPLLFYLRGRLRPVLPLVHLPKLLERAALGALLIAVLDPVLPSADYLVMKQGLDILLILDLSSSMQEPMNPREAWLRRRLGIATKEKTRLDAVKEEITGFVQKRHNDRIGVVVFSENAYVVAPMTVDTSYLTQYLRMVDGKTLASEGQTAIGEGILTALQLASQQSRNNNRGASKGRLMIVLTDGENNTGRDVYMAIRKASEEGFRIHFIGVDVEKARDAPQLIAAVQATGGSYYDVRNAEELQQAYRDIDRLERGTYFTKERLAHVPHFYPFALAAALLLSASIALKAIPYFIEIS